MELKLEDIVKQLNKLLELDPTFAKQVFATYNPITDKLAESDYIICGLDLKGNYNASALGFLNGLIYNNINKTTRIAVVMDETHIVEFKLIEVA